MSFSPHIIQYMAATRYGVCLPGIHEGCVASPQLLFGYMELLFVGFGHQPTNGPTTKQAKNKISKH